MNSDVGPRKATACLRLAFSHSPPLSLRLPSALCSRHHVHEVPALLLRNRLPFGVGRWHRSFRLRLRSSAVARCATLSRFVELRQWNAPWFPRSEVGTKRRRFSLRRPHQSNLNRWLSLALLRSAPLGCASECAAFCVAQPSLRGDRREAALLGPSSAPPTSGPSSLTLGLSSDEDVWVI